MQYPILVNTGVYLYLLETALMCDKQSNSLLLTRTIDGGDAVHTWCFQYNLLRNGGETSLLNRFHKQKWLITKSRDKLILSIFVVI